MDYEVGRLNKIAAEVTRELGLPFVDLQGAFAEDYAKARQRFEFDYDWHWNVRANRIVGATIARLIMSRPRFAAPRAPAVVDVKR